MTRGDRTHEDGGYGNSNLVGDSPTGVLSAFESREAVENARRDDGAHRDTSRRDADLGRPAERDATGPRAEGPDSSAGTTLDDDTSSAGRGGRNGLEN
ncbi:hypothetical protein DWG18_07150 [Lysobacter sp. TY2-98]|uniref:hypothetical protein n=1 Tax=Lysobacter sp. TY2-98 TaxID=2290922 RepID=UPI000E2042DC|nr:hypothetical protein [Lysobacter sp. TY2-98]AXK72081.1 hypothetical protein DWG18_07150 [Lysobacter sp. TY2-98]